MLISSPMASHRLFFLFPLFLLAACGPQNRPPEMNESLEAIDVLNLKLRAREEEFHRFRQKLASSPAHSRFKEESDLDSLGERLTTARLKLDVVRTSDTAAQPQAQEDFNAALSDLTEFLHKMESQYQRGPQ